MDRNSEEYFQMRDKALLQKMLAPQGGTQTLRSRIAERIGWAMIDLYRQIVSRTDL